MYYQNYSSEPTQQIQGKNKIINKFDYSHVENIDLNVVNSFGDEWEKFFEFDEEEINKIGKEYFGFFEDKLLSADTYAMDVGCGTGRWTKYLSNKVKFIEAVDPSKAIFYADRLLKNTENVRLTMASTENLPFNDNTFDFVMSVGVLHHIPNTEKAMLNCINKVKKGGYFFVYLYYALDDRGFLFKSIFYLSNLIRLVVSRLPSTIKKVVCDILAVVLYMPFVLLGRFFNKIGLSSFSKKLPLSPYQNKSFFIIRNDSLDRFGTKLEQRFTKEQIKKMMENCGLTNIQIPDGYAKWVAIGQKA